MPILADGTILDIDIPSADVRDIDVIVGARGPGGSGGDAGVEVEVTTPSSSWNIAVPVELGRIPAVAVYVGGKLVLADITASDTFVTVEFPSPTTGLVILT